MQSVGRLADAPVVRCTLIIMAYAEEGLGMKDVRQVMYPLHESVLKANQEEVAHLLQAGADPNTYDEQGMTPLAWAVYGGYREIVELLCCSGADVELRTGTGETALWHAEEDFGLLEIAAVLRRHGARTK